MSLLVLALLAAAEPLPTLDAFLDGDAHAPRSIDVDARARDAASNVFISQWEPRTGVPTSVFLPSAPLGARAPKDLGLTAEEMARRTLFTLAPLYKLHPLDAVKLPIDQVHDLGEGAIVVSFSRRVNELPVFRERVAVVLNQGHEPVGVLGAFSPFPASTRSFSLTAKTALDVALEHTSPRGQALRHQQVLFATDTELLPAWQVEVDTAAGPYTVVVSAKDGRLLSRVSRTFDFSFRVWAKASAPFTPLDSPEGDTVPHPTGLPDGWAPAMLTPAVLVSLDHAGLSTMDPWLPMGATSLSGNNVVAYADLYGPDGRNDPAAGLPRFADGGVPPGDVLPDGGTSRSLADPFATATGGAFDFVWNPLLEPTANDTQSHAAATHAFFVTNWLHDLFYDVGFAETAGNAQLDNKGRGGRANDPLLVEVNDFAGLNDGRFVSAPDGVSPRLQLFPVQPLGRATVAFAPSLGVDAGSGAAPMRAGTWNVSAQVVQLASVDGGLDVCGPLLNAGALSGKVAFGVASGPCGSVAGLDDLAADAGAVGLLIQNGFDTREPGITLPTQVLDGARATALRAALDAGTTITATLERTAVVGRSTAFDTTIVAHEWGHLLSSRLVGDANGLAANQSRGLAEGWSDFVALLTTLEAADLQKPNNADWRGAFAIGGHQRSATGYAGESLDAHYFGVRRFPYSIDPMRNALTFRHIVSNVPLPTTAPISPANGGGGNDNAEVHNAGEVWASALWEGTTRVLKDPRFPTFDQGRRSVLRLLVASLKATPVNPTFLEARDALLITAKATGPGEFQSFLDGLAVRGMGLSAQAPNRRSLTNAPVMEDFTNAGARWAVLDVRALEDRDACDNDGVLDVGETGRVQLRLMNVGSRAFTNSRLNLASDEAVLVLGERFVTATAEPFTPVEVTVTAELRADLGNVAQSRIFITSADPLVEQAPVTRSIRFNTDIKASAKEGFEADVSKWEFDRAGVPWEHQFRVVTPANSILRNTLFGQNSPVAGLSWATTPLLTGPSGSTPVTLSFTQTYAFEFDTANMRAWDGAQLQLSVDDGPFTLVPAAAISRTINGSTVTGYDGALEANTANPLAGQQAFRGSAMNQRVTVTLDGLQNHGFRVRFVIGTDTGGAATGWTLDDVEFTGLSATSLPFNEVSSHAARCVNKPPVLQASFPQNVDERTRVTFQPPPATDPNNDPITFSWVQTSGPTVTIAGDQFDAPEVRSDTQLLFTVTADDGRGGMTSQPAIVVVRNVNRVPTSSAGPEQTVQSGQTVTLAGVAMDPDGDTLVVRWSQLGGPAITFSSLDALDATFVAPDVKTPSEVNLELNVSDGPAAAPAARVTIVVTPKQGCGCSSFEGSLALGALAFFLRRRRAS